MRTRQAQGAGTGRRGARGGAGGADRVEEERAVLVLLAHEAGRAEVLDQALAALDPPVAHLTHLPARGQAAGPASGRRARVFSTHLLAVVSVPSLAGELEDEVDDVDWRSEVEERVAKIAFVAKIDWQVEEVIFPSVMNVNDVQERSLRVLVWNVLYHDRGPRILSRTNSAINKPNKKAPQPKRLAYETSRRRNNKPGQIGNIVFRS